MEPYRTDYKTIPRIMRSKELFISQRSYSDGSTSSSNVYVRILPHELLILDEIPPEFPNTRKGRNTKKLSEHILKQRNIELVNLSVNLYREIYTKYNQA